MIYILAGIITGLTVWLVWEWNNQKIAEEEAQIKKDCDEMNRQALERKWKEWLNEENIIRK